MQRSSLASLPLLAAALAACDGQPPATQPAPGPAGAANGRPAVRGTAEAVPLPTFVDVAAEAGVTAENHTGKPNRKDWIVSAMGGGAMLLDHDGDRDMDLIIVDGTMLTTEGELQYDDAWRTRLYRNDGNWRFTDVSLEAGIDLKGFGFGGAACDYDADGHTDFFVCLWGENRLYRNRGDGTFEDVTAKAGVAGDPRDMSTACAFGDVDGDGIHDLYVANYIDMQAVIDDHRRRGVPGLSAVWRGHKVYSGPAPHPSQADRLYLGGADGTFREVTQTNLGDQRTAGHPGRYGFQPIMTDVDNDGDLDIYVANDTQSNWLWINDGKGVFTDRALEAGVAMNQEMAEQAGMGIDAADVNRDGWMDLFVTNFSHDYNTIYLNRTTRPEIVTFHDATHMLQLATPAFLRLSWGTRLFDYDNDSSLDCFVACGHVYGEIDNFQRTTGTSYRQRCLLLHSQGPEKGYAMADVTDRSGPAFRIERVWRGAAFGDLDDDGDQDIYVAGLNDKPALFRNDGGNRNAFLVFRLVGRGGQRMPAGARVVVHHPDGRQLLEELHLGASFLSCNDPRLFFGLGQERRAPRVDVLWPGGERHSFEDVEARRFYVVDQASGTIAEDVRPE